MTQPSKPFAESAHGMAQLAHGELFLRRRSAANRSGTKSAMGRGQVWNKMTADRPTMLQRG
jgi:hypothetical protein